MTRKSRKGNGKAKICNLSSDLTLTLFKQETEYLTNYTSGSGFRVTIFPYNTEAFPHQAGVSIMSGKETYFAMSYVCLFQEVFQSYSPQIKH